MQNHLQLERKVCTDDVRVTTFPIKWVKNQDDEASDGGEVDGLTDGVRELPVDGRTAENQSADAESAPPVRNLAGILLQKVKLIVKADMCAKNFFSFFQRNIFFQT